MHVLAQAFWLPKLGNSQSEYEDAFWPGHPVDRTLREFACAIGDGATETSFSGLWSEYLVRAYCKGQLSKSKLRKALPRLQDRWLGAVSGVPLPWYAEEKLRSGAFAAIVGLTLRESRGCDVLWTATAVGDSCVFQIRGDAVVTAFPLEQPEQFSNRPILLSSNPTYNDSLDHIAVRTTGVAEEGDSFFLMTDALACWFLASVRLGERPWEFIRDLGTSDDVAGFANWVAELRRTGSLRNDDVTLLRVEI
jgi:hypothetical protein